MLYQGKSCPVCKRQFEDGDDVVFCPDCGTPHHRECYNLTGHCVNRALHKTGYDYYKENAPQSEENKESNAEKKSDAPFGVFPPALNGNAENNGAGANPVFGITHTVYDKDPSKIDGESIGDIAATVRNNAPRFINIFKRQEQTGKKTSWNWGAFFFGAYYLFFRKMYKQAITLFCVNLTLSSLASLLSLKLAPLTTAAFGELQSIMASGGSMDSVYEKAGGIQSLSDFDTFLTVNFIFTAITFIIRILIAVFADSMYKANVISFIKRVNEQLDSGASFTAPMMTPEEEQNMHLGQEQMKRLYLVKKGGVSLWAPFAAYLALYLIEILTGVS